MSKKTWILGLVALACLALPMMAQEPAAVAPVSTGVRWGAISAAFLLGIAAAAGAMAQGRATSAAAEAMSRNPGAAGPIRLQLALIESLVLYALLISNGISKL